MNTDRNSQTMHAESEFEFRPPMPGFRLAKFEVYNWGTFDGVIYTARPEGQTTLLIGENGSGKSTIVDALLTLLVRPQTRNYNVAAGATKNERDERTYIRGAFDRKVGDEGRPQVQYLRTGRGHYTILLACFTNTASKKSITLCQVLYLNSDNTVEKIYGYADSERSILRDLGDLGAFNGAAKQMRERGFRTSSSYKEYIEWFRRATGFRSKAMDVFNQTVAVKDVQRLDTFIRLHMLERKPWDERVGQLLRHFTELSDTHRMLMRARLQDELLRPVVTSAAAFRSSQDLLRSLLVLTKALPLYFAEKASEILEPLCLKWHSEIQALDHESNLLKSHQEKARRDIARLEVELEQSCGERLKQLPAMIEQAEQISRVKLEYRRRLESQLAQTGIEIDLSTPKQFLKVRSTIPERQKTLLARKEEVRRLYDQSQRHFEDLQQILTNEQAELETLNQRRGNLPESYISIRDQICSALKISPTDLPFAAELIAVAPDQHEWEASIEQVLHGFARTLLVPAVHYAKVAAYIDQTRLTDSRGTGFRLIYLKVDPERLPDHRSPNSAAHKTPKPGSEFLVDKLLFQARHPLTAWMRAEISQRFHYVACDSLDQFRSASGAAMTRNRHFKSNNSRHEKDDRNLLDDRRNFVLGWDNRAKARVLATAIQQTSARLQQAKSEAEQQLREFDRVTSLINITEELTRIEDFDSIDHSRHEFEAAQLKLELQQLESTDNVVLHLKTQIAKLRAEVSGYDGDRDSNIERRTQLNAELIAAGSILGHAQKRLEQAQTDGSYRTHSAHFADIAEQLATPVTLENIGTAQSALERELQHRVDKKRDEIAPLERELVSGMSRFLKKFPDEQSDLDAHINSLDAFISLHERITLDDLPKFESRFKSRLNEKVLHEVGLLSVGLETDQQEIRDKIEQLNSALKLLEWKPGTYMQLEPIEVQDREIQDFRRDLRSCLVTSFDSEPEANEAAFLRIEKLVEKLRDDNNHRWREKVVDVRNWFGFAAREITADTGESRSYYDGGTGQSGGEKGKLAFLVLVAAIAYQYDIDPDAPSSDRFHFVMVDEMFSRSDDQHAEYALDLFQRFGLQLLIVAPLDAKARVTEPYVGTYLHVLKNRQTNRSEMLTITAEELQESLKL